jgi:hypothetical protein
MNLYFEYAVKFVCGKEDGRIMAPGQYWTAINVHNPTATTVVFRKKVAIALPAEQPGPVSQFFRARLGPDQALEIDCDDIRQHTEHRADFLKGFVVIASPVELDVVAVYSAAGTDRRVETLHTERVPARRIEVGLPDLLPLPDDNGFFCKVEDGNLIVTVMNQGSAPAGPSVAKVDFGRYGTVTMPTPGLAPGQHAELKVPIPGRCFDPDCGFTITVDANGDVVESDESNNVATGLCIG